MPYKTDLGTVIGDLCLYMDLNQTEKKEQNASLRKCLLWHFSFVMCDSIVNLSEAMRLYMFDNFLSLSVCLLYFMRLWRQLTDSPFDIISLIYDQNYY